MISRNFRLNVLTAASLLVLANGVYAQADSDEKTRAAAPGAALPQVTVTATRNEIDVRAAPASVTVHDRQSVQEKAQASDDLLTVIEDTPGLVLTPRQVSGRKTFSLRGMNDSHTLVLIDGRRISASDNVVGHSDYQYGWMTLSSVDRVEVIRGPLSALYGSEALGGVVNIISRWPTRKWEGSVTFSGQTPTDGDLGGTGSKLSFFAGGPVSESLLMRLSGEKGQVGDVLRREDRRLSEIEGRRTTSGSVSARYLLGAGQQIEAGWQQGREYREYDDVSARGNVHYHNRYTVDRSHGYAQWSGEFASGVKAQLRTYHSALGVVNQRNNRVSATRPQDLRDSVGDGFVQWSLGGHKLSAGAEWRKETLINAGLTGGRDSATHKALFAQDEIGLTSNLMATVGARLDRHEIFGSEVSPRAYLVWQATPELIVKGGYGQAFQAPTLKQISPNYVGAEGPHTFLGNSAVRPETSRSFELGADWQSGPLALRGVAFHNRVKDLISVKVVRTQGIRRTYQYINVERATVRGLEAGLTWTLAPAWRWNNDLTVMRTKDGSGKELASRPAHVLQTQLQWRGPMGLNARISATHTGRQYAIGMGMAGNKLPAYTTFNLGLGQQVNKNLSWNLGLENAGDLRLADKSDAFGFALRGRTVTASVRVDF